MNVAFKDNSAEILKAFEQSTEQWEAARRGEG